MICKKRYTSPYSPTTFEVGESVKASFRNPNYIVWVLREQNPDGGEKWSWVFENQFDEHFCTLKEYRKIKLDKICIK